MSLADLLPLREREELATFTTGGTPVGVGDGGHGQIDEDGWIAEAVLLFILPMLTDEI